MTTQPSKLPTLFKKTSAGAIQCWRIDTVDNVIVTRWGQEGGAEQKTEDIIHSGKNLGKANATTAVEQAQLEALARWEKQLKNKKYVQSINEAEAGKRDERVLGGVDPMLAHRFDQHGDKLKYPCYAQPKLDGHRCLAVIQQGECTLWSRTRKPITGVPHINRAIARMACEKYGDSADFVLDGELYCHDYREKFEELTSFIRQVTPKPGHEVVEYHIYDMPSMTTAVYALRNTLLNDMFPLRATGPLKLVETVSIADEDELMFAFERFRAQGYEGAMARNADGAYVGKRSYDLLKLKEFEDAEFVVVDVEEGRGKMAGHAVFLCKGFGVAHFRAKMKGELSELKKYFDKPELAVGRQLTVQYQGLTKTGLPRFPVGIRLKEDV